MKFLTVICCALLLSLQGMAQSQPASMVGTWDITDFMIISTENPDTVNAQGDSIQIKQHFDSDHLTKEKLFWTLIMEENGELSQKSNMRNGKKEQWKGSWSAIADTLSLNLMIKKDREITIRYVYTKEGNLMDLNRSNPKGTMVIKTRFARKE